MQFTYLDFVVLGVVLISAYLAFVRGFTRELLAIGAWIIAAVAGLYLAPELEPLLREAPAVGGFFADNCIFSMLAAFALIMAVALLVLSVFTPIFSFIVTESALGPLDKALGFLFGVARGALLLALAFLIYTKALGGQDQDGNYVEPAVANAFSLQAMTQVSDTIYGMLPDSDALTLDPQNATGVGGWFGRRIKALESPCSSSAAATPQQP